MIEELIFKKVSSSVYELSQDHPAASTGEKDEVLDN
jgi:hypothetical protein